jgi:hypothetical protein
MACSGTALLYFLLLFIFLYSQTVFTFWTTLVHDTLPHVNMDSTRRETQLFHNSQISRIPGDYVELWYLTERIIV